jgi:DNA modification methylase
MDPFSGAATTGAVAVRHGRAFLGLELLESNNTEIAGPRLDAELEARKSPSQIDYLPTTSGVYHGAAEILLHRVEPDSVRLILTDPPYNTSRENNFHTMGREGINFEWDGGFDQETWIRLADKALMPGGSIVIWNDWKVLGLIAHLLLDLGYEVKRNLTWVKTNPWPRNVQSSPVQRTETGLWAVKRIKKSTKWIHNLRAHQNYEDLVFYYPIPRGQKDRPRHQTKKPDDMFREIIQIFSNPGDLVLDPFAGGGTTAYAAAAEGRRQISFELSQQWHAESLRHWAEGNSAKPLKFPTTPTEKGEAGFKKYLALCKRLGVSPEDFEPVENFDTHQDAVEKVDAPVPLTGDGVRLKGI